MLKVILIIVTSVTISFLLNVAFLRVYSNKLYELWEELDEKNERITNLKFIDHLSEFHKEVSPRDIQKLVKAELEKLAYNLDKEEESKSN